MDVQHHLAGFGGEGVVTHEGTCMLPPRRSRLRSDRLPPAQSLLHGPLRSACFDLDQAVDRYKCLTWLTYAIVLTELATFLLHMEQGP